MSQDVLAATLDVPFECAFLKAGAMNGLPTYPVPPVTTIQGMLYNALGRPSLLKPNELPKNVRDDEESFREAVQTECDIGIRVIEEGERLTGLRSRQKAPRSDNLEYVTYPAEMETIIQPTYRIYVGGPSRLVDAFESGLRNPQRPLYLGRSDDLVDIEDVSRTEANRVEESAELDCVVPGGTDEPVLLPVSPDYRGRYTEHPGELKTVSVSGGVVDQYLETENGERFVYVT